MGDSIHDDSDHFLAGSRIDRHHPGSSNVLKVYQTGPVTVVGFGGMDVPDEVCIAAYRDQLLELVTRHNCQTLAFDLTGVKLIPSGMLGVLVTLRKKVQRIELYNPSEDVLNVLQLTNLAPMFEVRNVDV